MIRMQLIQFYDCLILELCNHTRKNYLLFLFMNIITIFNYLLHVLLMKCLFHQIMVIFSFFIDYNITLITYNIFIIKKEFF